MSHDDERGNIPDPKDGSFTEADNLKAAMEESDPYPNRIEDPEEAHAVARENHDLEVEIAGLERRIREAPEWSLDTAEAETRIDLLRRQTAIGEAFAQALYRHPEVKDEFGDPLTEDSLLSMISSIIMVRGQIIETEEVIKGDPEFSPAEDLEMTKKSGRFDAAGISTAEVDEIGESQGVDSEEYRKAANKLYERLLERFREQDRELTHLLQPILDDVPAITEMIDESLSHYSS